MAKKRVDQLLIDKGWFDTLDQARRSILAGLVLVNQEVVDKVGTPIAEDARIQVKNKLHPYVSRGGLKLEAALRTFQIKVADKIVLDIGASTGGFTDCALQQGAQSVYAVDVGYGQLAWKLRQDERVVVLERTNFRYLAPEQLAVGSPTIATIDVSFISLRQILPNLYRLLADQGVVIALVKPQFEAERAQVGEKGIVRDAHVHQQVLEQVFRVAEESGFTPVNFSPSPIQGGRGNIEFLMHLLKGSLAARSFAKSQLVEVVQKAHHQFLD